VFLALGGILGAQDWRLPFWLYAVSLPLAGLAARWLWQPTGQATAPGTALPRLPWRRLAGPIAVTLLGGLVFYVLIVELFYQLTGIGVQSSATIGVAGTIASLGTAAGALGFTRLARYGPTTTVALAFALSGAGLVGLGLATTFPLVVATAVVTGLGNGLLLPALLVWALAGLGFAQRGRATGVWTSALFIGQFAGPLVVIALGGAVGGLTGALVVLGVVSVVATVAVRSVRSSDA